MTAETNQVQPSEETRETGIKFGPSLSMFRAGGAKSRTLKQSKNFSRRTFPNIVPTDTSHLLSRNKPNIFA
jgi:hypothetical protein